MVTNQMIKIEELASVLSEKYALDHDACQSFVAAMFDVVVAELSANPDSMVKIKGLGTFKITSAGMRDGRLSFTPEVMLRDRVNRPFLQFETVILNDGADFSGIDADDGSLSTVADADVACVVAEEVGPTADEACAFGDTDDCDAAESECSDASGAEYADGAGLAVPGDAESEPGDLSPDVQVPEDDADVADAQGQAEEASGHGADDSRRIIARQLMAPAEPMSAPMCKQRNPRLMYWLSAASFILLLLIGVGMYFVYDSVERKNAAIEKIEHKIAPRRPSGTPAPVAVARPLGTEGYMPKAVSSPAAQDAATSRTSTPPVSDYNYDPRVRTGAYVIVGIDTVVKVRKGQTLESISRSLLGAGMECYVEVVNGGIKSVGVGDTLRIPKLKLKPRH